MNKESDGDYDLNMIDGRLSVFDLFVGCMGIVAIITLAILFVLKVSGWLQG